MSEILSSGEPVELEVVNDTILRFKNSYYGSVLVQSTRYDRYRPMHTTEEEWLSMFGDYVNGLEHMNLTLELTEDFLSTDIEDDSTDVVRSFPREDKVLLLIAASTHNWGKSIVGDMNYELRTEEHLEKDTEAYRQLFGEFFTGDSCPDADSVLDVVHGRHEKLSPVFDAIKRIEYTLVGMRAYELSNTVDDKELLLKLQWMCASILTNHTEQLLEYSHSYTAVVEFLSQYSDSISSAFTELKSSIFEKNGENALSRKEQYIQASLRWGRYNESSTEAPDELEEERTRQGAAARIGSVAIREADTLSPLELVAHHELSMEGEIGFEELFERLKHITFRGLYDSTGRPLKPYENADFSLATVHPPDSISAPPLIEYDEEVRSLFTPQPTIYANQTEVIGVVQHFLKLHGLDVHALNGAVNYSWDGRGEFTVLPPLIEEQSLDLKGGHIDMEKLAERFAGTYIRDASGGLHELSRRFLDDFYIDSISSKRHFDIFNSNLGLLNYGRHAEGRWDYNIICDGSHRVDFAIEEGGLPIRVIVAKPNNNTQPLIPYYALPMPFRPTLRLSSKLSEKMYPRLERDKFHLFDDIIKKVLHYDWSQAGLNVSSLRGKTEIY